MSENLQSPETREAALYECLSKLGIVWKLHVHNPVFTVEEAAGLYAQQPGIHTKNLFLKDKKGGLWLVVCRDDLSVDLNALSKQLDAPRFSFGAPELLQSTLGIPPGSVTPFAILNDTDKSVRLVLDDEMLAGDPLNFHPLRNDRTIAVSASDLLRFVRSVHGEPLMVHLPLREA